MCCLLPKDEPPSFVGCFALTPILQEPLLHKRWVFLKEDSSNPKKVSQRPPPNGLQGRPPEWTPATFLAARRRWSGCPGSPGSRSRWRSRWDRTTWVCVCVCVFMSWVWGSDPLVLVEVDEKLPAVYLQTANPSQTMYTLKEDTTWCPFVSRERDP